MMILIADSGSTKTDWRILLPNGDILQAKTAGYNPHHQTEEEIVFSLKNDLLSQLPTGEVKEIHFYGAGCSSEKSKQTVASAFQEVFKEADITIEHDLLGAARALCIDEPGIACILGTGSNSCLYDGENITGNVPALGFILGDEGSGTDLGKRVVSDYLRGDMPAHLQEKFKKRFDITVEQVLDRIYKQAFPKPYLASFSRFLFHNLDDAYCYKLVYYSFERFIDINVVKYPDYQNYKVHFVGSVAFYYANILRQVATDKGLTVRNILESPIAGLTLYHTKELGQGK